MSKKILCILIALVLFLTCFSSCSDDEEIYLSCPINEMPQHFDPQIAKSQGEKIVAVNTFDGLFKLDENGQPQNCAVKDYKVSADGLVYTFYLHNNLEYYVSKVAKSFIEEQETEIDAKVTAQDFAFGITRAILPETNAPDYDILSVIKNAENVHNGGASASSLGVRVVDDYTLEITLERKSDEFLFALSQPVSYPCDEEFFNLTAGRYGLERKYTISNGAFYLSDIVENESVRFSNNTEYKGQFKATPTSARLYVNSDQKDISKKINSKNYSVAFLTSKDAVGELNRKVAKTDFQNTTTALVFNLSNETMQNNNLRTGLIESVTLTSITENFANNLIPSVFKYSTEKSLVLATNIDSAREKLKTAFNELKIDKLTVNVLCTAENENVAKNIISCWQQNIGVELNGTVTVVEQKDFDSKIENGSYTTAIYPLTVNSNRAVDFLGMFKSDSDTNISRYTSEEYDRIYNDFRHSPSETKATECETYLLKNAVVMPVADGNSVFVVAKDVNGVYCAFDSANIYFYKGQTK